MVQVSLFDVVQQKGPTCTLQVSLFEIVMLCDRRGPLACCRCHCLKL